MNKGKKLLNLKFLFLFLAIFLFIIVIIILYSYILVSNKKIEIEKESELKIEKTETRNNLNIGILNHTYYLISYKNKYYHCENYVFFNVSLLRSFLEKIYENSKNRILKEKIIDNKKILYLENDIISVFLEKNNKIYFCSGEEEEDILFVFNKLFS